MSAGTQKLRFLLGMTLALVTAQAAHAREILFFSQAREFEAKLGVRAAIAIVAPPVIQFGVAAYASYSLPSVGTFFFLGYKLITPLPAIRATSAGLLYLKETAEQRKKFETLLSDPSAPRIYQISSQTGSTEIGALSTERQSSMLTWIETENSLKPELVESLEAEWGKATHVSDPSKVKVRIQLRIDGAVSDVVWETTLEAIMDKEPIPESVREQWLAEYKTVQKKFRKNAIQRWSPLAKRPDLEAKISNPKKTIDLPLEIETELGEKIIVGPIASKEGAVKLLKTPLKERLRALVFDGVEIRARNLPIQAYENAKGLCPRLIRAVVDPVIRWVRTDPAPSPLLVADDTNH